MSFRPTVRRATTVSGAVLALCLGAGGVASADVLPSPVAVPTDPVSTVQQTVTSLSTALSPTPTPSTSPTPTATPTAPSLLPTLPLPMPSTTPTSTATQSGSAPQSSARLGTSSVPAATGSTTARRTTARTPRLAVPSLTGHASTSRTAPLVDGPTTPAYAYSYGATPNLALPPVRGVAAQSDAAAPAVAPLLMAPTVQHVTPLADLGGSDHGGGFPVRGLALALAVAAAGALGFEHLRLVARRVGG